MVRGWVGVGVGGLWEKKDKEKGTRGRDRGERDAVRGMRGDGGEGD